MLTDIESIIKLTSDLSLRIFTSQIGEQIYDTLYGSELTAGQIKEIKDKVGEFRIKEAMFGNDTNGLVILTQIAALVSRYKKE